jgi:hypothetical protein
MTHHKFLQAYQVTLSLVEQCAIQVGNDKLRLTCRSTLDSIDCPTLPVPSHAHLAACAKKLNAENTVNRLAHQLTYDSSLPPTFREIVKVVLHEDCEQIHVPGRLIVVLLFTSQVVLECLRIGCNDYVLFIARDLAIVISDSNVYDDLVYVLNSRFGGILDTQTSNASSTLSAIMCVTLGLIWWYFMQ